MRIPQTLVRQFYVAGSLRNDDAGFELMARNPLTDGILVGIGRFAVDGEAVDPSAVRALVAGQSEWKRASDVSRFHPVAFRKGDAVTFHVDGKRLEPGPHTLDLDLYERDLGIISLTLEDTLSD